MLLFLAFPVSHIFASEALDQKSPIFHPPSSFIDIMTKPAFLPPTKELYQKFIDGYYSNSSNSPIIRDNELKHKVITSIENMLTKIDQCLTTYDTSGDHSEFKLHLDSILSSLSTIDVYSLPKDSIYGISTQYRLGALNLPNRSILFNLNYPTWKDSLNLPFYLHEVLEALSYEDRFYQTTGPLWSIYNSCEILENIKNLNPDLRKRESIKKSSKTNLNIIASKEIRGYITDLLKIKLDYDSTLKSQNHHSYDSLILADGGGTTAIGGAGDPTAAYFTASLYFSSLQSNFDVETWRQIGLLKIEAFPGLKSYFDCKYESTDDSSTYESCKSKPNRTDAAKISDLKTYLFSSENKLSNPLADENMSYFYDQYFLYGEFKDKKNGILLLDAQLLHWFYSNYNMLLMHNYTLPEQHFYNNHRTAIKNLDSSKKSNFDFLSLISTTFNKLSLIIFSN